MGMVVRRTSEQEPQKTRANLVQNVQEVTFVGERRVTQNRCTSERFSPYVTSNSQSDSYACA